MLEKFLAKIPTWFPHDKCLHFISGLILFSIIILFATPLIALVAIFVIGLAKEWIYDISLPESHTVDPWDAVATFSGVALGYAIIFANTYR